MLENFPTQVHLLNAARELREPWSPRVVARVNDQYVKVAKLQGEFVWHAHEEEDELFLVVHLLPGALHVVPRGVQHFPVAQEECLIALIETVTTRHTGEVQTAHTRSLDEQLVG